MGDDNSAPLLQVSAASRGSLPRVGRGDSLTSFPERHSLGAKALGKFKAAVVRPCCLAGVVGGLVFAVLLAAAVPAVVRAQVAAGVRGDVVIDSEKAEGFEQFRFRGTDGIEKLEFFMFNITNPSEVLDGAKPKLEQLGPWVYDMIQTREDFEWNSANDSLAYREHTYYVLNARDTERKSGGRFTDDDVQVTTLNMLLYGVEAKVGNALWHIVCDQLVWKNDLARLFAQRTVREYLTGYTEKIDVLGVKIPVPFPGIYPNTSKEEDINWQKKSLMRVGASEMSMAYELVRWQDMESVRVECPWGVVPGTCNAEERPCCQKHSAFHKVDNTVPVWGTDLFQGQWDADANLVHGRNGEQFSPGLSAGEDSTITIFNDLIWRALLFRNHGGETVTFKGIEMLRFTPSRETFLNATEHPSNSRYYQFGPRGFFGNLSLIEQGTEIFVSLPHYLDGDPVLLDGVEGLEPNRDLHAMFIDVEPILGQTMVEHVRAQISGRLHRGVRWLMDDWFPHVRDGTFVPIGWFDVISEVGDTSAEEFKQIYYAHAIEKGCVIAGSALAVFFGATLLYGVPLYLQHRRHSLTEEWADV